MAGLGNLMNLNLNDLKLPDLSNMTSGMGQKKTGKLPTKRTINLASVHEKKVNILLFLPVAVLIVALVLTVGKRVVTDQLGELYELRREVSRLRTELAENNARIAEYDGIEEVYAHYTWADMTAEELSWPDYVEAMDLLERKVLSRMSLDSWDLQGNELKLSINGRTLQEINRLAEELNAETAVDYCSVTTAAMTEYATSSENIQAEERVRADIVIYLKPADREGTRNENPEP